MTFECDTCVYRCHDLANIVRHVRHEHSDAPLQTFTCTVATKGTIVIPASATTRFMEGI